MAGILKRPSDPYDPAWTAYRLANPGLRLSLSAGEPDDPPDPDAIDLSTFVPESFKSEDGKFDTAAFRSQYDEMASFKSTYDESQAALPKDASEYAFAIAEDHAWPEGFDPTKMATKDDDGNEVEFDPASLFDAEDPDIPLVQSLMHEIGAPAEAIGKIASIMANREARNMLTAAAAAEAETKALGPDAKSRIDTVTRTLEARMEPAQSKAILDSLTSADALRGMEKLIKAGNIPPPPLGDNKPDYSDMSPLERVIAGNKARAEKKRA